MLIIVLYAKNALIKLTSNSKLTIYIEPIINITEKINQMYTNKLIYKLDRKYKRKNKNVEI